VKANVVVVGCWDDHDIFLLPLFCLSSCKSCDIGIKYDFTMAFNSDSLVTVKWFRINHIFLSHYYQACSINKVCIN